MASTGGPVHPGSGAGTAEEGPHGDATVVTRIDHIELVVHRCEEHVALFRALGFKALTRTRRAAPDPNPGH